MNLTEYKASLPYFEALVTWPCTGAGWIHCTHSHVRYSRSVLLLSFNLRLGRPDCFVQDSPPEAHMVFSSSPCAQHAPPTTFLICLSSYYCRGVQVMKLLWAGSPAFVYLLHHGVEFLFHHFFIVLFSTTCNVRSGLVQCHSRLCKPIVMVAVISCCNSQELCFCL